MGTTTYSKDDWDNGATTNSKVTRTMGNWEQWNTTTYSERLKQLHCLQVHQSNRYVASMTLQLNYTTNGYIISRSRHERPRSFKTDTEGE